MPKYNIIGKAKADNSARRQSHYSAVIDYLVSTVNIISRYQVLISSTVLTSCTLVLEKIYIYL